MSNLTAVIETSNLTGVIETSYLTAVILKLTLLPLKVRNLFVSDFSSSFTMSNQDRAENVQL